MITELTQKLYDLYVPGSGVSTDSRSILSGQIYFALKGEQFNGNRFALQAIESGAVAAVVNKNEDLPADHSALIFSEDPLHELQCLALHYRKKWSCPVIAITGSNGKTTTKELMAAVLGKKYKTAFTKGNLNNHIGIPITILNTPPDAEMSIIEMGANHQHEIESYCRYTLPDYGLITNCGKAHLEGFGGITGVIKGKTELYRFISGEEGMLFVNADDELLMQHSLSIKRLTYGKSKLADHQGFPENETEVLRFKLSAEGRTVNTRLAGSYNFPNAMAAVCAGRFFKVPEDEIISALEEYTPTNNRSQWKLWEGNRFLMDAYNANPSSMHEAINNFNDLNTSPKAYIIGEMMELGSESADEHALLADRLKNVSAHLKILIGKGFSFASTQSGILHFNDVGELKQWWNTNKPHGLTILLKGSRANKLENLFN